MEENHQVTNNLQESEAHVSPKAGQPSDIVKPKATTEMPEQPSDNEPHSTDSVPEVGPEDGVTQESVAAGLEMATEWKAQKLDKKNLKKLKKMSDKIREKEKKAKDKQKEKEKKAKKKKQDKAKKEKAGKKLKEKKAKKKAAEKKKRKKSKKK